VALRIVFCGTPAFALPSLRALIARPDFRVEAVVTQPDRPRGRGGQISISPVKAAAVEARIQAYQPEKIKSDAAYEFLRSLAPDVVVIIAYGQIISQRLLDVPRLGWVNVHASLLPKYRGAAPINWAIVNGETQTGVTTMQVAAGLDTGPILLTAQTTIPDDDSAPELAARLAEIGAPLIVETLRKLDRGEITPQPQDDSQATLAPLLKKEDGRIEWSRPAQVIYNRIRGMQPWPGAFTTFRGKMCHVWGRPIAERRVDATPGTILAEGQEFAVACGTGTVLQLEFLQLEGRKRITGREFASGARLSGAERLE
jgi:methionyl-tRNA formyltransferase